MGNFFTRCWSALTSWFCKGSSRLQTRQFVQLYCQRRDDLGRALSEEIKTKLDNTSVDVEICDNPSQLYTDKPVIVVCINASRLGTDVMNALKGLTLSSLYSVVILHPTDPLLPSPQPSSRILTDGTYKSLGGMFDIKFRSDQSVHIYQCDMNTDAVRDMVNFIDNHN